MLKKRIFLYALGLTVLAAGLTLNTKVDLGVSPIVSVSYCVSQISGMNFGNATFLWYSILVLMQIVIHTAVILKAHSQGLQTAGRTERKSGAGRAERILDAGRNESNQPARTLRQKLSAKIIPDMLQIAVSLIFTRIVNLFGTVLPDFGAGKPMLLRLLILAAAIIFTGVGAVLSVDMRIIPNPGDGIVQTLSDVIGRPIGTAKNMFDILCVVTTLVISLIVEGKIIGIGIGTLAAALGVGRVMSAFNKITGLNSKQL